MFLYNSICNYLLELLPFLKKKTNTKDINKGVHLKKKKLPKILLIQVYIRSTREEKQELIK